MKDVTNGHDKMVRLCSFSVVINEEIVMSVVISDLVDVL
jgi:hypothetical protein